MTADRRRPRPDSAPRGRYAPELWNVWLVGPLTLLAALAVGMGVFFLFRSLAPHGDVQPTPVPAHDLIRTTLAALAFVLAVLAGVHAYRKQRLAEGDAHRADADRLAERYATAAEQLGHDRAAVRLAGVHAMTRLADDWDEQRQVCIDVLCAYLRMPYEPDPDAAAYKEGDREVRHTIIRVIRDHSRTSARTSWSRYEFDFTRATFDGGDLSECHFEGRISFNSAHFVGDRFLFLHTQFGSDALGVVADFRGARFTGGEVDFGEVGFNRGTVDFGDADFDGATVHLGQAKFRGATVGFAYARFTSGTVSFAGADFDAGAVDFAHAEFRGARVSFQGAWLSGGAIGFSPTVFGAGMVDFVFTQFVGASVDFGFARFRGAEVPFHLAQFDRGTIKFDEAQFIAGKVDFRRSEQGGATVTFEHVRGAPHDWGPFRPRPGSAE
ncbi:pentapeptide repeat-containing protein [Streptomyces sp. NPDC046876]|uniref:pentapeptide repeat-containing protein n=1 Tax=Streptomyces sp. NPDC046876 TaxID=3155616 RepID=UPI0033C084DA